MNSTISATRERSSEMPVELLVAAGSTSASGSLTLFLRYSRLGFIQLGPKLEPNGTSTGTQ